VAFFIILALDFRAVFVLTLVGFLLKSPRALEKNDEPFRSLLMSKSRSQYSYRLKPFFGRCPAKIATSCGYL
jgi:hypothetical protein